MESKFSSPFASGEQLRIGKQRIWIKLNHSCFFASTQCCAEDCALLLVSRRRQKEGEGSLSGVIIHACLFVHVALRAPWLHYLEGQLSSINGTLGEKHLSPHLQYNIHSYGCVYRPAHTQTHTQHQQQTHGFTLKIWKIPQIKTQPVISQSHFVIIAGTWRYAGIMASGEEAELKQVATLSQLCVLHPHADELQGLVIHHP